MVRSRCITRPSSGTPRKRGAPQLYVRAGMSRTAKLSVFVLFAAIAAPAAWLSWSFNQLTVTPEPFVSERWKELAFSGRGSNDPGCYRGAMALDAVKNRILLSKKPDDLVDLIGAPEKQMPEQWFYSVGQCSGDWVHNLLALTFGANGVVTNVEVVRER